MTDRLNDSLHETGEVLIELTAKAGEAMRAGASRRALFARTAKLAGATALGAAGIGMLQPLAVRAALAASTAPSDSTKDILNIAATAEALAVTFYYFGLASTKLPGISNPNFQNYFQAAIIQEYVHLEILKTMGGNPLATKFFFPVNMFTDPTVFFPTASELEDYFISAYIAAAMEFSGAVSTGITVANPAAIGLSVQIAGIECEHRALLNVASGVVPPNNRIIESALVSSVGSAASALMPFLSGGSGFRTGALNLPPKADVNDIAGPYGFSSFPAYTIV